MSSITITDYFGKYQITRKELVNDEFFKWFLEENGIDLKTEEDLSKVILDFANNNNFEENLKQYVLEQEHFEPYYLGFSNDEAQWREEYDDLEYNIHEFETPSGETWFLGCGFSAIEDVYPPKITKNMGELNSLMETIKKSGFESPDVIAERWSSENSPFLAEANRYSIQRDGYFGDYKIFDEKENLIFDNVRKLETIDSKKIGDIISWQNKLYEVDLACDDLHLEKQNDFSKSVEATIKKYDSDLILNVNIPLDPTVTSNSWQGQERNLTSYLDVDIMKKAFDYAEKISETPGCEDVCMEMNSENFVELSFNEDGLHKTEEIDSFFQFEKSTYDSDTEELIL